MSTDGAEVSEVLAHGGVFIEEQLERLGALVRLCGNEECFKEVIGAEPDINDEACGDWWSLSRGWPIYTVGADLQRFLSKLTTELCW
jgi:hypothetical protein